MVDEKQAVEVVVCLGSSCFARGNAHNLSAIEAYVANHGLQTCIHLTGCLCQDQCKRGPNLAVNGEEQHEIDSAKLKGILHALSASER